MPPLLRRLPPLGRVVRFLKSVNRHSMFDSGSGRLGNMDHSLCPGMPSQPRIGPAPCAFWRGTRRQNCSWRPQLLGDQEAIKVVVLEQKLCREAVTAPAHPRACNSSTFGLKLPAVGCPHKAARSNTVIVGFRSLHGCCLCCCWCAAAPLRELAGAVCRQTGRYISTSWHPHAQDPF